MLHLIYPSYQLYCLISLSLSPFRPYNNTWPDFSFSFSPQEEELRKSGEAKYAHLSNDLHVLIEAFAPPGEAYSRMSYALEEIKKFLVPVSSFKPFHLLKFLQGNCELYIQMGLCTSALVDSSTGAFFALSDVIESLQG